MKINFFWFRRDLRIDDNCGLFHALKAGLPVMPIFIFDEDILSKLKDKDDARVSFIYESLQILRKKLQEWGSDVAVFHGKPLDVLRNIISDNDVSKVFTNHDYEPYAIERDELVADFLRSQSIGFETFKDQVIYERQEVMKSDGKPYTVFTPYSKKWKARLASEGLPTYDTSGLEDKFHQFKADNLSLSDVGFEKSTVNFPERIVSLDILKNYAEKRDFPAIRGTSKLSVHLRFGTVSVRKLVAIAQKYSETWLNELIWREFYMMILYNFPEVVNLEFNEIYRGMKWNEDEELFQAWCEGKTGFPLVDAGMRELNATGFMHNRVRMLVASFLVKDLLIDWRKGEWYFAQKLLDFELSSNNGGWQWAASTGCDAAPYFRIFSPDRQMERFDPDFEYVKKWVPEYGTGLYPQPIVDHKEARLRAVEVYKEARAKRLEARAL